MSLAAPHADHLQSPNLESNPKGRQNQKQN